LQHAIAGGWSGDVYSAAHDREAHFYHEKVAQVQYHMLRSWAEAAKSVAKHNNKDADAMSQKCGLS
jgi:hypothetical protein